MAARSPTSIPAASISVSNIQTSPTLSTLVPHLLSARRSLACVEQVSNANTVIRSARQIIESQTALSSRTLYIRHGCQAQIGTLQKVSSYIKDISDEVRKEWKDVVNKVDEARERLAQTVEVLKQTRVESKLREPSAGGEEQETEDDRGKQYLADFVDETGFMAMLESIDQSMQTVSEANEQFDGSVVKLVGDIEDVRNTVQGSMNEQQHVSTNSSGGSVKMTDLLQEMEQHAGEMAKNLESLVKHFDLCVTAIKHTEGGGVAAFKVTKDLPDGFDLDLGKDEPLEEIDEEEMDEIRAVIEKDAAEVDDVVAEIKAGMEEVEICETALFSSGTYLKEDFRLAVLGYNLLEDTGKKLPAYITEAQLFAYKWEEERAKILDNLADLETLRDFYANFIVAYDNLLIEVGRRKDVEKRINKIRKEAMTKIDNLINEEIEERRSFKSQQGDYLPIDIWPGLTLPPSRYDFVKVTGELGGSTPDISASVINRAIKRVSQSKTK